MKSKKTIIFIISILAIAAGAWWYFKMRKPEGTGSTGGTTGTKAGTGATNPNPGFTPAVVVTDNFPLRKGSKGPRVLVLQKHLNKVMNAKLAEDGIFGVGTENALQAKYKTTGVDKWGYDNIYSKNV